MVTGVRQSQPTDQATAPRLLAGRLLRGCNVHHGTRVFAQRLAPGALSGLRVSDAGTDFALRFAERFDGLGSPAAGGGRGGVASDRRLTEVLLQGILAIERFVARAMCRLNPPRFSRMIDRGGEIELVWEAHAAWISRAAARAGFAGLVELLPSALRGAGVPAPDFAAAITDLRRKARRRQWSTRTAVLAMAAKERGLPHELLAGNYLRLGEGARQQVVSESALAVFSGRGAALPAGAPGSLQEERRHRLLVVGGAMVSALRCDPPGIVGDGTSTLEELIDRLNDDPLRNDAVLRRVRLDERLRADLARLGLDRNHVPPPGQRLALPGVTTLERGAVPVDVTPRVHQSVRKAALLVARRTEQALVDLEFMTGDIARSCRRGAGRVIATTRPDPFLHAVSSPRRTTAVGRAILDAVFPAGLPGTVPTAVVVGERGTRSVARALDRLLRSWRDGVGLATRDRTTIQGRPVDPTSLGRRHGPAFLLGDPCVSTVVGAVSPRSIVQRGLGLDRCSVTALLDPAPGGDLAVYRAGVAVILRATTDAVVIGADNPCAAFVLDAVGSGRAWLVSRRRKHPLLLRHLAAGGSAVSLAPGRQGTSVQLRRGAATVASLAVAARPGGRSTGTERWDRNTLFTAALALALGVPAAPPRGANARLGKRTPTGAPPALDREWLQPGPGSRNGTEVPAGTG
jgi:hypothetical protein